MAERGIDAIMVKEAIFSLEAEPFERNMGDARGPSLLILGWREDGRPLHVLLGFKPPMWVITAYDPSEDEKGRWASDLKTRLPRHQWRQQ